MTTTMPHLFVHFFFFNDTATTEIYTLSLHDALPISPTIVCGPTETGLRRTWIAFVIANSHAAPSTTAIDEIRQACAWYGAGAFRNSISAPITNAIRPET